MTQPPILIISHLREPSVDDVIEELNRNSVPWRRLNSEMFPLLANGSFNVSDHQLAATISDCLGNKINFREVGAVWFRRMGKWILPKDLGDYDAEFAENEVRSFMNGMFHLTDHALWVNNSDNERKASNKIYQLSVAKRLGFEVPRTIVTNSPDCLRAFLAEVGVPIIFKPLSGTSVKGVDFSSELKSEFGKNLVYEISTPSFSESVPVVFANVLTPAHFERVKQIEFSPTIFQEQVQKRVEIRVTVVGNEQFCAEIHSQEHESTRVDFRRMSLAAGIVPTHRKHLLPVPVQELIANLMRELGLEFACLDLILTPDGRYVFLEINPNGQWQWIEKFTGLPITKGLASLLVSKAASTTH